MVTTLQASSGARDGPDAVCGRDVENPDRHLLIIRQSSPCPISISSFMIHPSPKPSISHPSPPPSPHHLSPHSPTTLLPASQPARIRTVSAYSIFTRPGEDPAIPLLRPPRSSPVFRYQPPCLLPRAGFRYGLRQLEEADSDSKMGHCKTAS